MPLPLNPFAKACAQAVGAALGLPAEEFAVTSPPKPDMGDYAVGCFPAAKKLGAPPPALAAKVVAAFVPNDFVISASQAGPFVNFKVKREALYRHLFAQAFQAKDFVPKQVGSGKTVCVDYSGPNIAKHLAYHHIRSTVIGRALVLMYRALGFKVVGINHLGDWGTTHGMLLCAYDKWGADEPLTIDKLNEMYVRFRAAMKEDPALEEQGRAWFKRLEDGDEKALAQWKRFREISLAEFQTVYDVLKISFEEVRGESEYESGVKAVLDLLEGKNLTEISDGAEIVPLGDDMPPLLLKKSDGATLYSTRDLAAARYRWDNYHFDQSLYVVDRGQALHFAQLFATLDKAGFEWAPRCKHVPFGLVRIGGKKTGTRTGNVVLLREVLAEAEKLCRERIATANPELPAAELGTAARMVGVGAVVFANLVSQREKDVDFSWEEVLSWDGDAAPYIQYAHARCSSLLQRAQREGATLPGAGAGGELLTHDLEWALAMRLADFSDMVLRGIQNNEPHHVCHYLLETCATYSRWYTAGNQDSELRVLATDPGVTTARLALCAATRGVLRQGLSLLGCEAPDLM